MEEYIPLYNIKPGETATVQIIGTQGSMRRRFQDIGLIEKTNIECVGQSPFGDPAAYLIRGAVIAIRADDCKDVLVSKNGAK